MCIYIFIVSFIDYYTIHHLVQPVNNLRLIGYLSLCWLKNLGRPSAQFLVCIFLKPSCMCKSLHVTMPRNLKSIYISVFGCKLLVLFSCWHVI